MTTPNNLLNCEPTPSARPSEAEPLPWHAHRHPFLLLFLRCLTPSRVGNFRVEPPGLFRGRGEHPKMGKLKNRIKPRDITINIGKDAPIPECSIPGERWKEVKHDNNVTWLAFWNDPINPKEFKYVFLAASSSLKGQSDKEKYEKARIIYKIFEETIQEILIVKIQQSGK
ncbi:DNA topoisomerase 1 beta-like [Zingiber officinale]|uniref:DNA topoisomerase 1 beta-like n=1 Tax=Zingiber officinale TaxID=94328 RepID=UPI001C4AFEED|nr:DNA topoisomerase 1 beta-like [Zingiber officinale]